MLATFTVGALALAARRANAIGAVRLTLHPAALEIELVRVAGFTSGFAPGGVADGTSFSVPYLAVRGLVREGRMLWLTLDPAIAAPYNRFALARFSEDPAAALARAYQARAWARWASAALPAPLGALAALLAPVGLASGALGRASFGVLAALTAWAILREILAWRTWGGPLSDRYRDALEAELSRRLGLLPARADGAAVGDPLGALDAGTEEPRVPWAAWLAAGVAAAGVVGALVFLQAETAPSEPPPAVDTARAGLAVAVRALHVDLGPAADDAAPPAPPLGPRCVCQRADSPLWKAGVPRLAVLLFEGEDQASTTVTSAQRGPGPLRYDFDVAVVNDGARPLRDVRITITFARRSATGRRVGAVDRGLFWGGELGPGRAVKWHVTAPGTELRVDASVNGTLEEGGLEPGPADAFFALTASRWRALRVHGAAMLAYLRDPRARDAAAAFGARTPEERLTADRLARAAAEVIVCDATRVGDALEACVFNGSSRPAQDLELREGRAEGAEARRFPIPWAIPVHEGARVSLPFEGDPPEELFARGHDEP